MRTAAGRRSARPIARHTHKADRAHKSSWHKAVHHAVHHASKHKSPKKNGKCPVVVRDAVDKTGKTDKQVTADDAAVLGRGFVDRESGGSSTWYADAGGFTAAPLAAAGATRRSPLVQARHRVFLGDRTGNRRTVARLRFVADPMPPLRQRLVREQCAERGIGRLDGIERRAVA